MPNTKNALLRYRVLDHCFSDFNREYLIADLLQAVNEALYDLDATSINIRQLRTDIAFMKSSVGYNAPIETYHAGHKQYYYRYSDRNFSIFKEALTNDELATLRATIDMLSRYRHTADNAWLEEVITQLECRFGVTPDTQHLIDFGQNARLQGLQHLSLCIDATVHHQVLEITYQSYRNKQVQYLLHPYFMKQYNNRWFLFGLQDEAGRITNVALDRITTIRKSKVLFIKNKTTDFSTYFNDVIGVSVPTREVEKIVLQFTPERFPYVLSKPLHPSQEMVMRRECKIAITVKPNKELYQQIFSFIPDVEIISPQWLREEIQQKIQENLQKYLSVHKNCTL